MPHDGQEETDQEKINRHMVQMETEQGRKDMAKELIQQRRVIRQNSQLYTNMLEHFEKAKGVAKAGATVLKQVQGMQWDLLQLMAQVTTHSKKCNVTWLKLKIFNAGGPEDIGGEAREHGVAPHRQDEEEALS